MDECPIIERCLLRAKSGMVLTLKFAHSSELASALPKERRGPIFARLLHFFFVMASDFIASSDLPIVSFFVASAFMASPDLPMLFFFMPSDFIPSPDLPIVSCAWAAPVMAASESARARKRLRVEGVMTYLRSGT